MDVWNRLRVAIFRAVFILFVSLFFIIILRMLANMSHIHDPIEYKIMNIVHIWTCDL
jgi:hypothetical protein